MFWNVITILFFTMISSSLKLDHLLTSNYNVCVWTFFSSLTSLNLRISYCLWTRILIKNRKRRGPQSDPCGTPRYTEISCEILFIWKHWIWLFKIHHKPKQEKTIIDSIRSLWEQCRWLPPVNVFQRLLASNPDIISMMMVIK